MLEREHGEKPTEGLMASLLLEMLPDHVQLTVARGMFSRKLVYEELKAKVKRIANVQVTTRRRSPWTSATCGAGTARSTSRSGWR